MKVYADNLCIDIQPVFDTLIWKAYYVMRGSQLSR